MKKAIILAAFALLSYSSLAAQTTHETLGDWSITTTVNDETGEKIKSASTVSNQDDEVTFSLQCQEGQFSINLKVDNGFAETKISNIIIKIDTLQTMQRGWKAEAGVLSIDGPQSFVKLILPARILSLSYRDSVSGSMTVTFDLTGIDKAYEHIQSDCGQ